MDTRRLCSSAFLYYISLRCLSFDSILNNETFNSIKLVEITFKIENIILLMTCTKTVVPKIYNRTIGMIIDLEISDKSTETFLILNVGTLFSQSVSFNFIHTLI